MASSAPCTVADFAPKPPPKPITFGMAPGLGIGELYLREELVAKGYHLCVLSSCLPGSFGPLIPSFVLF
jgi:hypothetical protein